MRVATQTFRFDLSPLKESFNESLPFSVFQMSLATQEILGLGIHSAGKVSRRLDFFYHEFQARYPLLNSFLYIEEGFKVLTEDKCGVDDYFIGKVLETRMSSPLAFAIIYRELAQRLNLVPVNFVNFPGLSLIKILYNHQLLFIDPSNGGALLSISDLQTKLYKKYGQSVVLSSSFLETPSDNHVANRLLTKLKNLYFDSRKWDHLLGVLDLLVWLNPSKIHELKERGLLLYQLGLYNEAKTDLSRFVTQARPSQETEKLRQLVTHLDNPGVIPLYD
jgi:regulator of sirC expression with transglutaminase-like and TPR domain